MKNKTPKTKKPVKATAALAVVPEPEIVRVRYDSTENKWAVLDNYQQAIRHFDTGHLTDVVFESEERMNNVTCVYEYVYIGVACGIFHEGTHPQHTELRNLSFNGTAFVDKDKRPVKDCSILQLLPERRALYIK